MIQPEERAVLEALAEALLVLLTVDIEPTPEGLGQHEEDLIAARGKLRIALSQLRAVPTCCPVHAR